MPHKGHIRITRDRSGNYRFYCYLRHLMRYSYMGMVRNWRDKKTGQINFKNLGQMAFVRSNEWE